MTMTTSTSASAVKIVSSIFPLITSRAIVGATRRRRLATNFLTVQKTNGAGSGLKNENAARVYPY
jgi:hypothetical protein